MITSVQYSSNGVGRTALGSVANLSSLATGTAAGIGAIDNSGSGCAGADGFLIDLSVALAASGVSSTGTLVIYLIQSQQSTTTGFTDGISPTGTSVAGSIKNAIPIKTYQANTNGQVIQDTFRLPVPDPAEYSGIVVANNSGAALASSGHSVDFTPYVYLTQ